MLQPKNNSLKIVFFVLFIFIFLNNYQAYAGPKLSLEKKSIKMGDIEEGKNYKYDIEVKNSGDSSLHIKTVTPSCDCISILQPEKEITLAPNEKSMIKINFNSTGVEGDFVKYIYAYTNDPSEPIQKITFSGRSRVISSDIIERVKNYGIFIIITSGLIDGINPCAFTVLVFFISFLTFSGYRRKQVLQTGLVFIAAVFLTYFLIGLGFFRIVQGLEIFRRVSNLIRISTGILTIALGVISVYDFFVYKFTKNPDKIKLKLPHSVKTQIQNVIRQKSDIRNKSEKGALKILTSAFICGFIVSLLESICTGQTYLPTIMFMFRIPELKVKAVLNLVIYNFMFIMPLLFILGFGIMGVASESFAKVAVRHLGIVKIITAVVFFVLGISLFIIK